LQNHIRSPHKHDTDKEKITLREKREKAYTKRKHKYRYNNISLKGQNKASKQYSRRGCKILAISYHLKLGIGHQPKRTHEKATNFTKESKLCSNFHVYSQISTTMNQTVMKFFIY